MNIKAFFTRIYWWGSNLKFSFLLWLWRRERVCFPPVKEQRISDFLGGDSKFPLLSPENPIASVEFFGDQKTPE